MELPQSQCYFLAIQLYWVSVGANCCFRIPFTYLFWNFLDRQQMKTRYGYQHNDVLIAALFAMFRGSGPILKVSIHALINLRLFQLKADWLALWTFDRRSAGSKEEMR